MNGNGSMIDFTPAVGTGSLGNGAIRLFRQWRDEGRLGFMDLPHDSGLLEETLALSRILSVSADGMIVCGIGGSSLGLRALLSALGKDGRSRVSVADSPNNAVLREITENHDPGRTVLAAITKSGGTAETMAMFGWLLEWMGGSGGGDGRIVAVTDPRKGDLRRLAGARGWHTLPVPPAVGGRFSVLSPVGLFPAAFAGIDVKRLLEGAGSIAADFDENGLESLPGRMAAEFLQLFRTRPVHVFMPYDSRLFDTALWFQQLWAESLGKMLDLDGNRVHLGQTPLACRGPADQHSLLQLFMEGPKDKTVTILTTPPEKGGRAIGGDYVDYPSLEYLSGRTPDELRVAEALSTGEALQEMGVPVSLITLEDLDGFVLGQLLMSLEITTVLVGLALNIDPLDQPGVERSKVLTYRAMKRPGYENA